MTAEIPPTIIVVHPREKRSKCSVEPLRDRDDFVFWTFPEQGPESLAGYFRLGMPESPRRGNDSSMIRSRDSSRQVAGWDGASPASSMECQIISEADRDRGMLVLDGTWRLAARMEKFFRSLPLRSLPPVKTAYPRSSKLQPDPEGGLATIEAIYAADRLRGRTTDRLLDHYLWGGDFLELNGWG